MSERLGWKDAYIHYSNENQILWNELWIAIEKGYAPTSAFKELCRRREDKPIAWIPIYESNDEEIEE